MRNCQAIWNAKELRYKYSYDQKDKNFVRNNIILEVIDKNDDEAGDDEKIEDSR